MREAAEQRSELRVRAPAKVNLYLEVLGRRPDGFHEIRTVMQAVSLFDELEFSRRPDGLIGFSCAHPDVPAGDENLVVRAATALRERWGVREGVDIRLHKHIPVGGGLGGGSSDCAVTLLALRELWKPESPAEALNELAADLGSDVPFFLQGGTALCEGRGERVGPLGCPTTICYVLVMPEFRVSTAAVYDATESVLTMYGTGRNNVTEALRDGHSALVGRSLRNDLQAPAFIVQEGLLGIWNKLEELKTICGFDGLLLSGSGASFFAVMPGEREAVRAARTLQSELGIACAAVNSVPAWGRCFSLLTVWRAIL